MSDNPRPLPGALPALPGHRLARLSGPGAVDFAQAQFMNDVASLAVGDWHWNGWLTPKGRLVALFALLRADGESLWLVLPDADPGAFVAALERFVFRSKVVLDVPGDLAVSGAFETPISARGRVSARLDEDGSVELDMSGEGGARRLRIGPPAPAAPDEGRWRAADLEHGLPRLDPTQAGQWTPQQLSLERLGAFSVKKGCYPGQEIVARTHFLGKAKRGLVLLDAPAPVSPGDAISQGAREIGRVASVADTDGRSRILAVVPTDRDEAAPLRIGDLTLETRPLLAGLQR